MGEHLQQHLTLTQVHLLQVPILMLEPLQEHPQVDPQLQGVHLMVGHHPQARPHCLTHNSLICLCPISLMHIHPKVDTHNNSPRLTTLHKDRHPLLLMGGMDNSLPTTAPILSSSKSWSTTPMAMKTNKYVMVF